MTSQWAAVGAETDLLRRARQLQKSWERLLAGGALGPELPPAAMAGLRPMIVESWRRSLATGLDPTDVLTPIEATQSEVLERWLEHPLGSLTHVLAEQFRILAEESHSLVVVTDASGLVLHRVGDERLKERATAEMNLVEGARYSEAADGTNGIGTALAADHAFQVFGFEHFNERHHEWVCSGAPVHDPVSGRTVGLIDLSSAGKDAHPRSLELVTAAATTLERCLLEARQDRNARLSRRYGDLVTRSSDLLLDRDGYVLDGADLAGPRPFDIPEGGGEVVLGDGSVAVAAPLGQGEAYLLRRGTTHRARSARPAKRLERAEERARELADEQAALRHVATLVARESPPDHLFAAVAEQVARVLDVPHVRLVRYEPDGSAVVGGFSEGEDAPFPMGSHWPLDHPGVVHTVRQQGRPARVEDYADVAGEIAAVARDAGMRSAVGCPIVVERRLWGAMVVLAARVLPADTEARLTDFTELVATAIANAESREALAQLVEEQAALRRVATLVAGGTGPDQLFAAVADEVQELFGAEMSAIVRFEEDGTVVTVGTHGGPNRAGARAELDPEFIVASVRKTRRVARFDTDDPAAADMPAIVRETGARSAVASPIVIEGKVWGAIVFGSVSRPLPPGIERRLADFTDLVATAVANTQAREEVTALAEEQAALRRVATLVARGARPDEVLWAVSEEVGRLFGTELAAVGWFETDGRTRGFVGGADGALLQWELTDFLATSDVYRTGRSARTDAARWVSDESESAERLRSLGIVSSVASPIVVEGELWGAMTVAGTDEPLPPDTEERLEKFTELVATAIANAESREARAVLTEEQTALRRVAVLVAQDAAPAEIFAAVSAEVGRVFGLDPETLDLAAVGRFEPGPALEVVGVSRRVEAVPLGSRWPTDELFAPTHVRRTGRSARIRVDDLAAADGEVAAFLRRQGYLSQVASPIVVDGRLWGAMSVNSRNELPPDTEERLERFTGLVATAIANAEGSAELAASRRRIVAASDDARRRIERNLHDGVQQQLVALGMKLGAMKAAPPTGDALKDQLGTLAADVVSTLDALVEVARGIHPAILAHGGLAAALKVLGRRSPVPVELHARIEGSLPDEVEVAAYYVAAEALTNTAKHAHATLVEIEVTTDDGTLTLIVRDDGVGGADPGGGSGLVGLQDRVKALGGSIKIDSPPGHGTRTVTTLPIATEQGAHV